MRLLDLYCGGFGTAYGYASVGWKVDAVDVVRRADPPHPNIRFIQADANTYPLDGYDAVAGSPPCTGHSTLRNAADVGRGREVDNAWMLRHTIERFRASGLPYVVENVMGARALMPGAFQLCGTMFGLVDGPYLLERHRLFLTNMMIMAPGPHKCRGSSRSGRTAIGVYGDMSLGDRRCDGKRGRKNGDMRAGVSRARRLMGMPWADAETLALAIPPAYTAFIGEQLMQQVAHA